MLFGNGYTFKDVYEMPVHIRNFHYKKLGEAKKKEKEQLIKLYKKHHQVIQKTKRKSEEIIPHFFLPYIYSCTNISTKEKQK